MMSRNCLKALGASDYLAQQLTRTLAVIGRVGRSYGYAPAQVLASVKAYGDRPRIRPQTRLVLAGLTEALAEILADGLTGALTGALTPQTRLDDAQPSAHPPEDPLAAAMARVRIANDQFEATAQRARQLSSEFDAYRAQRGADFKTRNNIVTFA